VPYINKNRVLMIMIKLITILLSASLVSPTIFGQQPEFKLDVDWPKIPFGDNWLTGGLGGMCIDNRDHVYLLNRQNVVAADLDGARLAPPVIELNPQGEVVRGWGDPEVIGPRAHDCHVEEDGSIWIVAAGTGHIQKYSNDGSEMLMQIGLSGTFDSSNGTREGAPLNSNAAQFFLPSALDVDELSGDIYVADGELPGGNSRIAVLDREGNFLRQWGLYRTESDEGITPLPHCLRLSNDGLVYVCDREADRIQVFDRQGNFVRNIFVGFESVSLAEGRSSGNRGSAVVLAFSHDQEQEHMFVINQNSVTIEVLDRQSGRAITRFGDGPGRYRGQFTLPHGIGVDSLGNVYIAEQEGRRIQKYLLIR